MSSDEGRQNMADVRRKREYNCIWNNFALPFIIYPPLIKVCYNTLYSFKNYEV